MIPEPDFEPTADKTTELSLPLFGDDDKPTWRGHVNYSSRLIDAFVGEIRGRVNDAFAKLSILRSDHNALDIRENSHYDELSKRAQAASDAAPLYLSQLCKGDGTTDDTAALQRAIDFAKTTGRPIASDPAKLYAISAPVVIDSEILITGTMSLVANGAMPSMLNVNSKFNNYGKIYLDGKNHADVGVKLSNGGRARLGDLSVKNCRVWGVEFDPSGNNNMVHCNNFVANSCGTRFAATVASATATTNVSTSVAGYGTLTLAETVPERFRNTKAGMFVLVGSDVYKISAWNDDGTLNVINLNLSGASNTPITILVGGGLGVHKYGDNGVGYWGSLDIANNAIGIQCSSLYGHEFNNAVMQANGIGFAVWDYTQSLSIIKPYFELNVCNVAVFAFAHGSIVDPIMPLSKTSIQFIQARVSADYRIPRLRILDGNHLGNISGNVAATINPSARTLTPGQAYSWYRSGGSWNFTLDGDNRDLYGQYVTFVSLNHGSQTTPYSVTFTPKNTSELVDGEETSTFTVTGNTLISISYIYNSITKLYEWRTTILSGTRNVATSISGVPAYKGQMCVIDGVAYVATNTTSKDDWKQISN